MGNLAVAANVALWAPSVASLQLPAVLRFVRSIVSLMRRIRRPTATFARKNPRSRRISKVLSAVASIFVEKDAK